MKTCGLTMFGVILLLATSASASTITYGSAQWDTADTDVVTTGTFVTATAAINAEHGGTNSVTVNGVPFASTPTGYLTAPAYAPVQWDGLVPLVSRLLPRGCPINTRLFFNACSIRVAIVRTLEVSGLIPGQNYLVQMWANFCNAGYPGYTETIDGVPVTVNSGADGSGAGQYITGTFTADNTGTQNIVFVGAAGNGTPILSAWQVRNVTAPEPSTLALLAGGLIGLVAYAWRKRK